MGIFSNLIRKRLDFLFSSLAIRINIEKANIRGDYNWFTHKPPLVPKLIRSNRQQLGKMVGNKVQALITCMINKKVAITHRCDLELS